MYLKDNLRGSSSALHLSFYSSTVPLLLTPLSSYFIVFIFLFHSLSSHPYPFYSNSSSPTLSFHASSYSNFFLFSPLLLFISFILFFVYLILLFFVSPPPSLCPYPFSSTYSSPFRCFLFLLFLFPHHDHIHLCLQHPVKLADRMQT